MKMLFTKYRKKSGSALAATDVGYERWQAHSTKQVRMMRSAFPLVWGV